MFTAWTGGPLAQGSLPKVNPTVRGAPPNEPPSALEGKVNVGDAPVTQFSPILVNTVGDGVCGRPLQMILNGATTTEPAGGVAWGQLLASVAATVQWTTSLILSMVDAVEPDPVVQPEEPINCAFTVTCSCDAVPVALSAGTSFTAPTTCVQVTLPVAAYAHADEDTTAVKASVTATATPTCKERTRSLLIPFPPQFSRTVAV